MSGGIHVLIRSRIVKIALGGLAAILLGAVGSGVWERLLSPALHALSDASFRALGAVSSSFKDAIYAEAAKGFHEVPPLTMLALFLGLATTSLVAYSIFNVTDSFKRSNVDEFETENESHAALEAAIEANKAHIAALERSLRRLALTIAFLSLAFFISASFLVVRSWYINTITTYATNSIDIVAPASTPEEVLSLRSEFARVRVARDFYAFNDHLLSLSKRSGLPLPTFSPL
jgi:hypothetical protein